MYVFGKWVTLIKKTCFLVFNHRGFLPVRMGGIMEPKEMKLPEKEKAEIISSVFIQKEWVIDPAALKRLRDDVVIDIIRAGVDYHQEVANLQAKMWSQISETLKKQK
jgi:hypothetical protein